MSGRLVNRIREAFRPPAAWLRHHLRPPRMRLCRVEGIVAGGERPLTLLYSALQQNKIFLLELVFQKIIREAGLGQGLGRVRSTDAFHLKPGEKSDLVILETDQAQHAALADDGWFFIPAWVMGEVRLPLAEERRRSETFKTIRRAIRKHGFEYEVTRAEDRLKDYYHHMHVPYLKKTYGATAYCITYDELRQKCGDFDLILLRQKNRPGVFVAGLLIVHEPAGPRFWSLGVRDADEGLVRNSVLAALYLFGFHHLTEKGVTRINMGSCRPFLRDGVLAFKKRLSQTLVGARWQGFALRVRSLTPAAKDFLTANPFIFLANGRLMGAVFTAAPLTVANVVELDHEFFYPGMSRLVLYFFEDTKAFAAGDLPSGLAARVEIRPAAEIISGHLHLP